MKQCQPQYNGHKICSVEAINWCIDYSLLIINWLAWPFYPLPIKDGLENKTHSHLSSAALTILKLLLISHIKMRAGDIQKFQPSRRQQQEDGAYTTLREFEFTLLSLPGNRSLTTQKEWQQGPLEPHQRREVMPLLCSLITVFRQMTESTMKLHYPWIGTKQIKQSLLTGGESDYRVNKTSSGKWRWGCIKKERYYRDVCTEWNGERAGPWLRNRHIGSKHKLGNLFMALLVQYQGR